MDNIYCNKIDDLVNGKISELTVEASDFMLFREAWLVHSEKKNIIGEASLNGKIIYRYQKNEKK